MEHGICVNTEGSYSCGCQSGYATAYDTLAEAEKLYREVLEAREQLAAVQ